MLTHPLRISPAFPFRIRHKGPRLWHDQSDKVGGRRAPASLASHLQSGRGVGNVLKGAAGQTSSVVRRRAVEGGTERDGGGGGCLRKFHPARQADRQASRQPTTRLGVDGD